MKKTLSILLLLFTISPVYAMEKEGDSTDNPMVEFGQHNQQKELLLKQLEETTQQIDEEKKEFSHQKLAILKKWDRKTALAFGIATGFVGLKTAYDIYAHLDVSNFPQWLSTTNFVLDSIMIAGNSTFGLYYLCKSCCRKVKEE